MKKTYVALFLILLVIAGCDIIGNVGNGQSRALEPGETVTFVWQDTDTGDGRYYEFYYCDAESLIKDADKVLVGQTSIREFVFSPYDYLTIEGDYLVGVCAIEGGIESEMHWSSDADSLTAKQAVFQVDNSGTIWLFSNISNLQIY